MTAFKLLPPLRTFFAVVLLAGLAAVPHDARSAQDSSAFVANLGAQGIQVLGKSVPPAQRVARFRQILDADFDLPGIARFVLGANARTMSPTAQQEFLPLFREYLAQAYAARLGEYGGTPLTVVGSRPNGGETVVASHITRGGGEPLRIDWHVIEHDGRLRVTDVAVDGVSMKASQRQEFASIVQRNGGQPDTLVAALRQQVGRSR